MKNKLFLIGDSFMTEQSYSKKYIKEKHFWGKIIDVSCDDIDVFVNGDASRDIQTIIDIWIKILPNLTKKDYLVIMIPYFNRTRLPLDSTCWLNFYGITERFVGTDSYNNNHTKLELWDDKFDYDYFKHLLSTQELINASKASQLNYIEIIESLKLLSPLNTYIMSWDNMEYKSDVIDDKEILTRKMGKWETLGDEWIKSNGELGVEGDFHWGLDMNNTVANYIIKLFNFKTNGFVVENYEMKLI